MTRQARDRTEFNLEEGRKPIRSEVPDLPTLVNKAIRRTFAGGGCGGAWRKYEGAPQGQLKLKMGRAKKYGTFLVFYLW